MKWFQRNKPTAEPAIAQTTSADRLNDAKSRMVENYILQDWLKTFCHAVMTAVLCVCLVAMVRKAINGFVN